MVIIQTSLLGNVSQSDNQGFEYYSSQPVFHYLQAVLFFFIKI
jgi:hypothetical protein